MCFVWVAACGWRDRAWNLRISRVSSSTWELQLPQHPMPHSICTSTLTLQELYEVGWIIDIIPILHMRGDCSLNFCLGLTASGLSQLSRRFLEVKLFHVLYGTPDSCRKHLPGSLGLTWQRVVPKTRDPKNDTQHPSKESKHLGC